MTETAKAPPPAPEERKPPPASKPPRPSFWRLRGEVDAPERILAAVLFLVLLGAGWTLLTRGAIPEQRMVGPTVLPSPGETLRSFPSLWFDRALSRNLILSLWRVLQGFGLAALVGIPLGVACGCWRRIDAFFAPLSVFGRNVPISAMLPLTLLWFGIDELQKVMFIFVACVMFVVFDSARAVASVDDRYLQTALTLGANGRQVLFKVLVPLALPEIFGSLRLLFGMAFGYIILAEMVNISGGVGALVLTSQRQGPREHVYLALVAIALVAYGIDRLLLATQRLLFPYRET